MADQSSRRAVIRLELDVSVKRQINELSDKRGMPQIAVLSRLVKWFSKQDEVVQASVLGLLSDDMLGDLTPILHKRLASSARSGKKR